MEIGLLNEAVKLQEQEVATCQWELWELKECIRINIWRGISIGEMLPQVSAKWCHIRERMQRASLREPELRVPLDILWNAVDRLLEGQVSPFDIAKDLSRLEIRVGAPAYEYDEEDGSVGDTLYDKGNQTLQLSPYGEDRKVGKQLEYKVEEWMLEEGPYGEESKLGGGEYDQKVGRIQIGKQLEYREEEWMLGENPYGREEFKLGEDQYSKEKWKLEESPYSENENWQLEKNKYGEVKCEFQEHEELKLKERVEVGLGEDELGYEEVEEIDWLQVEQEVERLRRLDSLMVKSEPEVKEVVETLTETKPKERKIDTEAVTIQRMAAYGKANIEEEVEDEDIIESDDDEDREEQEKNVTPDGFVEDSVAMNRAICPMHTSTWRNCAKDSVLQAVHYQSVPSGGGACYSVKESIFTSAGLFTRVRGKTSRDARKPQLCRKAKARIRSQKLRSAGVSARGRDWIKVCVTGILTPVDHLVRALDLRLEDEVLAKANRRAIGDKNEGVV